MAALYFEHAGTKKRYRVVSVDANGNIQLNDAGEITLEGPHGQFREIFSKPHFKAMGYRPITVDDEPDEPGAEADEDDEE